LDVPGVDIDRRGRTVLEATVEHFIRTGEPVASAAVARRIEPSVSSATVRTEMARLEARGFLSQPHTSAGRVPTDRAYRVYVDGLLLREVDEASRAPGDGPLPAGGVDLELKDYLRSVTGWLSQQSDWVGIVVSPPAAEDELEVLEFVRLGGGRVMVLAVTRLGAVSSRILRTMDRLDDRELGALQDALQQRLHGRTLSAARRLLGEDPTLSGVLPFEKARDVEVFVEGVANMLKGEPFADLDRIRRAVVALESGEPLRRLPQVTRAGSVTVRIGEENGAAFADLALIACGFGEAERACGSLGVVGPKRMDYSRLIPLVASTAEHVSEFVRGRRRT
jgi:heat-inducible transcriptional repressor